LREPCGEDTACRASAHDDVIKSFGRGVQDVIPIGGALVIVRTVEQSGSLLRAASTGGVEVSLGTTEPPLQAMSFATT
jgi:hypothetical protein